SAQPGVSIVRSSIVSPLLVSKAEWGTRQFIWLGADEVARIKTQTGSTEMVLERDDAGNWSFEEFPDIALHETKLQIAMEAWTTLAADMYIGPSKGAVDDAKDYGVREESYTVQFTAKDGRVQGFQVGRADTSDQ